MLSLLKGGSVLTLTMLKLDGLSFGGKGVLATLVWVVTWWVTEPFAIGGVSLLPIVLLPLLGSINGGVAARAYADPMNFLFIGGFALAFAMEECNLHERIALSIIVFFSGSLSGIILGVMFAGFIISMWVSNTATAMMLLPIATAVAAKVINLMKEENVYTKKDGDNFTTAVILCVSLGAIIGGSASLIGTPPNVILAGLVKEIFAYDLSFGKWLIFATPLCVLILLSTAFYVTKFGFPMDVKKLKAGKSFIVDEKTKLGKMSSNEKVVATIFSITVFFWLSRTF